MTGNGERRFNWLCRTLAECHLDVPTTAAFPRIHNNSTHALQPISRREPLMLGNIVRGPTGNIRLQIIRMVLIRLLAGLPIRLMMQPKLTDMQCVPTYSLAPEEKLRRRIAKSINFGVNFHYSALSKSQAYSC
jgi:hypothetical protein